MNDPYFIDYERFAATYSAYRRAIPSVLEHLLREFGSGPVNPLLEIGCGTANHLHSLCLKLKSHGFGIDLSPAMLSIGAGWYPNLHLAMGDAGLSFPLKSASFQAAVSVNMIHYIEPLAGFFSEARRVLKPGGLLVIVTESEADIQKRTLSHYFPETMPIDLARYPLISDLEAAMRSAGFRRVWTTFSREVTQLTEADWDMYAGKAMSALQLLPEEAYQRGLARMQADMQRGDPYGRTFFTYVWGQK